MPSCTFFGHRDCPDSLKPRLLRVLRELILQQGVDVFYVGNQGQFDAQARSVLRELEKEFPHIRYAVVLAYLPGSRDEDCSDTMFPEGLETVHPRYAIARRNEWMLRHSDYVVTWITHPWGGAARYAEVARRKGKQVIPLCSGLGMSNSDLSGCGLHKGPL